jgi:hypothetical protein
MIHLTENDLIVELKERIACFPTAKDFAITHGLSESYIHDLVLGRRSPGTKALRALGYKKIVYYVKE